MSFLSARRSCQNAGTRRCVDQRHRPGTFRHGPAVETAAVSELVRQRFRDRQQQETGSGRPFTAEQRPLLTLIGARILANAALGTDDLDQGTLKRHGGLALFGKDRLHVPIDIEQINTALAG